MTSRRGAVALLVVMVTAACGGGGHPATSSPPPESPTTAATAADVARLQNLAVLGSRLAYAATYSAHLRSPVSTATWRVWRSRTALRVDILTQRVVATLIVSPRGSYSCRQAATGRRCFRVAGAGAPIPAPFDYAPHDVFTTDVEQLARNTGAYDVTPAGSRPARRTVPAATCFAVKPGAGAPKPQAEAGTYCLSGRGLLVSITYPSGNDVQLTGASLRPPPAARFVPYASPTPVG